MTKKTLEIFFVSTTHNGTRFVPFKKRKEINNQLRQAEFFCARRSRALRYFHYLIFSRQREITAPTDAHHVTKNASRFCPTNEANNNIFSQKQESTFYAQVTFCTHNHQG